MSGALDFVKDTFFGGAEKKAGKVLERAGQASADTVRDMFGETQANLQPFIGGGQASFEKQQALSGALGPEAQKQAFADFQEDPGTQFLRDQGLRLSGSKSGARGTGGGERLRELTKFSQGLALQDLSNRFNRLGAGTATGLSAAGTLGGLSGNAATGISQGLQFGAGGKAEGLVAKGAGIRAGIQQVAGGISGAAGGGGFLGGLQGAFGV